MKKCMLCKIAALFAGMGAINWLLVAYADTDLVVTLLGSGTFLAKLIYTFIGLAGILIIVSVFVKCPKCK